MSNKLVERRERISNLLISLLAIAIGATAAAFALSAIILPNGMLDGGVTGIAIMLNKIFPSTQLTFWIAILNVPFVIFAYIMLSKRKAFLSIFGITIFSILSGLTHHMDPWIVDDKNLALIFGGVMIGAAIGIVIKFGGAVLDGAEIVSVYLDKVTRLNTDTVLFIINIVIFSLSSLVFGVESALYSIVMFYVAAAVISKVNKLDFKSHETIELRINTTKVKEVNEFIYKVGYQSEIQRVIGGYHLTEYLKGDLEKANERIIVTTNVSKSDIDNMSKNIKDIDEKAYITTKKITEL